MNLFAGLPLPGLIAAFAVAAALVWFAGARLALCGDEMAERFDLGREMIGLIFLAGVTELPEIVTTITAAQVDNPALVLGNLFGGITLNTAILAVVDIFVVRHALTSWPRKPTHALLAAMLIALLGAVLAVTVTGDRPLAFGVGVGAVCLACGYPLVIALLRRFDERASWAPIDLPDDTGEGMGVAIPRAAYAKIGDAALILRAVFHAAVILVAGVALALAADALATQSALGASFIGVTLLAAATSLPELSTSIAAARIGAYTMAIANIFGSNLIMVALILPADIAYRAGPVLSVADDAARFSLATGIVVTAIYVAGILIRRTPSFLGAGLDSWLVLAIFLGSLYAVYAL